MTTNNLLQSVDPKLNRNTFKALEGFNDARVQEFNHSPVEGFVTAELEAGLMLEDGSTDFDFRTMTELQNKLEKVF